MIFEVEAGGVRRRIEARRRADGTWVVKLDSRDVLAALTRSAAGCALLIAPLASDACDTEAGAGSSRVFQTFDIAIEAASGRGGEMTVYVGGRAIPVSVSDRGRLARGGRERAGGGSAGGDRPAVVAAPMPGRVVKVLVKPGDAVAARQGVIVVEAMKMENELRAPRAGTVVEVCVREGMSVEAQAPLVTIS
ncbi:MAG TPA: acetyl-CoA carboxylase biotin carboxyl carrier protein subunit [Vicinamibacterales bacterium]|nr:acetyl-CoA carboxylase biotin carboxyl carrier protein subunit [Vicinamibacterales bacterium]